MSSFVTDKTKKYVDYWHGEITHSDKASIISMVWEKKWEELSVVEQTKLIEKHFLELPLDLQEDLIDIIKQSMEEKID